MQTTSYGVRLLIRSYGVVIYSNVHTTIESCVFDDVYYGVVYIPGRNGTEHQNADEQQPTFNILGSNFTGAIYGIILNLEDPYVPMIAMIRIERCLFHSGYYAININYLVGGSAHLTQNRIMTFSNAVVLNEPSGGDVEIVDNIFHQNKYIISGYAFVLPKLAIKRNTATECGNPGARFGGIFLVYTYYGYPIEIMIEENNFTNSVGNSVITISGYYMSITVTRNIFESSRTPYDLYLFVERAFSPNSRKFR